MELAEHAFPSVPWLQRIIRRGFLATHWDEPTDRLVLSQVGHDMLAHVACRYAAIGPAPAIIKACLTPAALRRVREYVDTGLDRALTAGELAAVERHQPVLLRAHVQAIHENGSTPNVKEALLPFNTARLQQFKD